MSEKPKSALGLKPGDLVSSDGILWGEFDRADNSDRFYVKGEIKRYFWHGGHGWHWAPKGGFSSQMAPRAEATTSGKTTITVKRHDDRAFGLVVLLENDGKSNTTRVRMFEIAARLEREFAARDWRDLTSPMQTGDTRARIDIESDRVMPMDDEVVFIIAKVLDALELEMRAEDMGATVSFATKGNQP